MNPRQHAVLARKLQDACGGADTCVNLLEETPFKMGRTYVYACRDAASGRTMPIGAIAVLEERCGQKLYSSAVYVKAPPSEAECALSEAFELNETGSDLQRLVRLAAEDGVFTEHEKRQIEPVIQLIEERARGLRAAMDAAS